MKMSPAAQKVIILNLKLTLQELSLLRPVRMRQLEAVRDELARASRGEW